MVTFRRFAMMSRPAECRHVGRLIQAYLDGEVDVPAAEEVAAHLDECLDCGLEAETFRQLKAAVRRQGLPDPESQIRLREFAERLASGEMDA